MSPPAARPRPAPGAPSADGWRGFARWQPAIWLAMALAYFALDQARQGPDLHPLELLALLLRALVWGGVGMAVSWPLSRVYRSGWPRRQVQLTAPFATLGAAALWLVLFVTCEEAVMGDGAVGWWRRWPQEQLFAELFDVVLAMGVWTGAAFSLASRQQAEDARLRAATAEAAAARARLDAVRQQLSPHFLFNTLNTAIALVEQDPDHAESVLTELSALLRATLDRDVGALGTVAAEVALARRTLRLEQVRFGGDLDVELAVAPDTEDAVLPVLLVQSLLDNAIKHGAAPPGEPLRLRLRIDRVPAGIQVDVHNTGRIDPGAVSSTGRGLDIARAQLAALDPPGHLDLSDRDGMVRCRVHVPTQRGTP